MPQTIEELRKILAEKDAEIELLKAKKAKPKAETIYDLIENHLKVTDTEPDAYLWVDLLCLFAEKIKQTNYQPNYDRLAEYKIDNLQDMLRVVGLLKNNKIFGATKNKSKMKYTYKGFEDLDANTYILYALQDTEQKEEVLTLSKDDF